MKPTGFINNYSHLESTYQNKLLQILFPCKVKCGSIFKMLSNKTISTFYHDNLL